MNLGDLSRQLGVMVRRGLRPRSPAAFAFAIFCVVAATLARAAIDLAAPNAVPFATYFPAILFATLVAGLAAGVLATVMSALAAWYLFVPPRFVWSPPSPHDLVSIGLFVVAALAMMWIADAHRRMLRRLDEEEHYRQVVVEELGHRVKNKLATIYAILRHELRGHPDLWESISGRLRALSAADDFMVKSEVAGIELRQILAMELEPYDASRVALHGDTVVLHDKLPVVLALIFHELATNAAKYGALSSPAGRVDISWRAQQERVTVEWVESGGPPVSLPTRRSFGSNLIERSLDTFDGAAKIEFAPAGLVCRLRFPTAGPGSGSPTVKSDSLMA
jgi:two-component sensor histidine kinase